jgi:hypothetical protein
MVTSLNQQASIRNRAKTRTDKTRQEIDTYLNDPSNKTMEYKKYYNLPQRPTPAFVVGARG